MPNEARPKRIVIDTDAANEIDDQFAIAWALRCPTELQIEGIHAAPFSHGQYFSALRRVATARGGARSRLEKLAVSLKPDLLAALVERTPAELGMTRSFDEILNVCEAAGIDPGNRVKRGSAIFMTAPDAPVESEAVDHLIELAHSASPEQPIHVATIGAPTNVASALLIDPSIASNVVVLFLAGFPTGAGLDDDSFNLVQDRHASNALFGSEARLVYVPGYHIAETLQLSRPAAREWLGNQGKLADYLLSTYENNPINPEADAVGQSWVLWDIIATAWLLDQDWVPTRTVPRAYVDENHRWQRLSSGEMLEAYHVERNTVMREMLTDVTRS